MLQNPFQNSLQAVLLFLTVSERIKSDKFEECCSKKKSETNFCDRNLCFGHFRFSKKIKRNFKKELLKNQINVGEAFGSSLNSDRNFGIFRN